MDTDKEKRVPIKIRPVLRKHQGKITEPYKIMERLLEECDEFAEIREAKIRMYWRKDWQADADGVVVGAQCAKASDRERLLAEEHGEGVDLIILLPAKTWPTLDDEEKEHRLYHQLCHFAPAKDSNGEQKLDEKDRPQWRLKRHPIVAFPGEIARYGVDRVLGHNELMQSQIEDADLPLFKGNGAGADAKSAEQAAPSPATRRQAATSPATRRQAESSAATRRNGDGSAWQRLLVADELNLTPGNRRALERAGLETMGKLSQRMDRDRWWEDVPGIGPGAAEKIGEGFEAFWQEHPEAVPAG